MRRLFNRDEAVESAASVIGKGEALVQMPNGDLKAAASKPSRWVTEDVAAALQEAVSRWRLPR